MNKKRLLILGFALFGILCICGIVVFLFISGNWSFYKHTDKILRGEVMEMHGESMNPTLEDGEKFTIEKDNATIERGDIIVYEHKTTKNQFVKRVTGIPGDTIELKNESVYLNGQILDEPYLKEGVETQPGNSGTSFTLKENEYFVLGDNRSNSSDSRHSLVGLIEKEQIIGVFIEKID